MTATAARTALPVAATILVALALGLATAASSPAAGSAARLGPNGIGSVRFGLVQSRAIARLRSLFGAPSSRGINTGCGPRYAEVEWGNLTAEFRAKQFTGYRYRSGGYPLTTPGSPRPNGRTGPRLATATGITLGSTLRQLHSAYAGLHVAGASIWRATNGLLFVDNAKQDPAPLSSRIVEIKIGTCGAF